MIIPSTINHHHHYIKYSSIVGKVQKDTISTTLINIFLLLSFNLPNKNWKTFSSKKEVEICFQVRIVVCLLYKIHNFHYKFPCVFLTSASTTTPTPSTRTTTSASTATTTASENNQIENKTIMKIDILPTTTTSRNISTTATSRSISSATIVLYVRVAWKTRIFLPTTGIKKNTVGIVLIDWPHLLTTTL